MSLDLITDPQISAREISRGLSRCTDNIWRRDHVRALARNLADSLGYKFIVQHIPVDSKYGNQNIILDSGHEPPLLITAHYDAFVIDKETGRTVPGANDNGSGIGAVINAMQHLKGMPVNAAFFGAEEIGHYGAKKYIVSMGKKRPRAIVNMDTCGSGGKLGILIPSEVRINKRLMQVNPELNSFYLDVIKERGFKVYTEDSLVPGDHYPFIIVGIPATTIQGENCNFYGMENGGYTKGKGAMHTEKDTIRWVNEQFLDNVVEVLVKGSRRMLMEK